MCAECEHEVDTYRPQLESLIEAERQCHKLFPDDSPQQHTIRLACTIIDAYHETGHNMRQFALGFSMAIQKVLALQAKSELPPL